MTKQSAADRLIEEVLRLHVKAEKAVTGPDNIEYGMYARIAAPKLARMLKVAIGRIRGLGQSTLYDAESKWARNILAELDRIAEEGE